MNMATAPLADSSGTLDVYDSGGDGQPIVLGHGLVMNHTEWSDVIAELVPEFRCIVPVLPLGGHRGRCPTTSISRCPESRSSSARSSTPWSSRRWYSSPTTGVARRSLRRVDPRWSPAWS